MDCGQAHRLWPGTRTGQAHGLARPTDWPGPRTGQAHKLARSTDWPGPWTGQAHRLARPTDCGQALGLAGQAHGLARPANWPGLQTATRNTNWPGSWTVASPTDCARPTECGLAHGLRPDPRTVPYPQTYCGHNHGVWPDQQSGPDQLSMDWLMDCGQIHKAVSPISSRFPELAPDPEQLEFFSQISSVFL